MKFHSFALYTLIGCMGTGSLAFAQSDMTGAKPQTEETANMAAKQHTAGVPLGMTRNPGTAYNPPKSQ